MKQVLAMVVAFSAAAVLGQPAAPRPLTSFDDLDAAGIGTGYKPYRDAPGRMLDYDSIMKSYETPPPPPKRELGPIDKWRFDSCQTDAAKAPTSQGVFAGLRVCREKFGR